MKKTILVVTIISFCVIAKAQPYSISFAGSGLSTVKVENLTTGAIVNVPAGDVLLLSATTGIPDVNNKPLQMKIYPNPITDKSTLEILPPLEGDIVITICDMSGKVLTQFKGYVENFTQLFSLSDIRNGLHIINVQGNGYQFSEKLLSNGNSNGTASIVKISNDMQAVAEKKSIIDSKRVQGNVNMTYTSGERLKYTAVSGNNKTVMTDIPTSDITVTFTFVECKDGDNIYYPVVIIGTQSWMAENLNTTKYNDGTAIPNVSDVTAWAALTTGGYCDYDNTPSNSTIYGKLYNFYTIVDTRKLCPTDWHVPTDVEMNTLENYLIVNGYNYDGTTTGKKYAKALASTTRWASYSGQGTVGNIDYPAKRNNTGFTALPGGYRYDNSKYFGIGYYGTWWSSTEYNSTIAWSLDLHYTGSDATLGGVAKQNGFSVRCLRD
jgi:uncharacterized protein (TIGR02145 family)